MFCGSGCAISGRSLTCMTVRYLETNWISDHQNIRTGLYKLISNRGTLYKRFNLTVYGWVHPLIHLVKGCARVCVPRSSTVRRALIITHYTPQPPPPPCYCLCSSSPPFIPPRPVCRSHPELNQTLYLYLPVCSSYMLLFSTTILLQRNKDPLPQAKPSGK